MINKHKLYKELIDITDDPFIIKTVLDINDLIIQGAKSVALASLKVLERFYRLNGPNDNFYRLANLLQKIRPSQVITHNIIEIIKKKPCEDIFEKIRRALEDSQKNINNNLLNELITLGKNRIKVMTHCHSSEEVYALVYAKRYGVDLVVYVTETRPRYQGVKTARELAEAGISVKYIVDSAAGFYMKKVDLAIFGCDAIRKEGIINKIGTYMIALTAKDNKKEVWFIGDILKTDLRKELIIEMRDPREITNFKEKNIEILNPAFDITPWKHIDRVITDRGIFKDYNSIKNVFVRDFLEKFL